MSKSRSTTAQPGTPRAATETAPTPQPLAQQITQPAPSRSWRERIRPAIIMFGLAIIPMIYALILTGAYDDPLGNLSEIPAAIVNEDRGTQLDGSEVNLGATITTKLLETEERQNFQWREYSAAEATQKLANGQVYAVLSIPASFSNDATSVARGPGAATRARLSFVTDDALNYIVGNVGRVIASTATAAVSEEVSAEYLDGIYLSFGTLSEQLRAAAGGAGELGAGLRDASRGATRLTAGAGELAEGAGSLATGTETVAAGAARLNDGAAQLAAGAGDAAGGAGALSEGVSRVAEGASAASLAAGQLRDGATRSAAGLDTLAAGSRDLAAGSQKVAEGNAALAKGTSQALAGAQQLSAGSEKLTGGLSTLNDGLSTLIAMYDVLPPEVVKAKLSEAQAGTARLLEGSAQLQGGIATLVGGRPGAGLGPNAGGGPDAGVRPDAGVGPDAGGESGGLTALASGAQAASAGAAQLKDGAAQLAAGTERAAAGAQQALAATTEFAQQLDTLATGSTRAATGATHLADGTALLATGSSELANRAPELAAGARAAHSGATQVSSGATALANNQGTLRDGLHTLREGATTLEVKLSEGAEKIPVYTPGESETMQRVGATPVELSTTRAHPVSDFGAAVACYFIALAMWVGAIGLYLMRPPLSRRLTAARVSGLTLGLGSVAIGALMGIVQAGLLVGILHFFGNVDLINPGATFAICITSSLVYIAINQALIALFGAPGRFIALLMIVIQLGAAGGIYPVETAPGFFRAVHPLLPVTHTVNALRAAIAGGPIDTGTYAGVLGLWFATSVLATVLAAIITRRRTDHPDASRPREAKAGSGVVVPKNEEALATAQ
ncbi:MULTISPECIES: YhgE/Pip domain-containing protein [Actinomycetaceae]|uniref:YhgE/Pip domain-containing protein n=3 Tax=Actinomycetaceae TaxID=2049 RepID=A0ABZ0RD25_9ACTO|nr:YhgE/Pip domain-containing protein [Actinotignum sanguinis]WPJ88965.1 YhgE/Pip domain-containing protein [Schaalia turicensis]MDE1553791.1 YhgE/Pip domain-containing protein [Actinotignum sanguinis]MDE1566478.1 YhgE/Pip domain-containing protein [Actinotignum sanguinis]MDE1578092.1 YhgE/Pip domain-containing protein [Actinotignum sanguinis]MDK8353066.1 YhgE/Pip domain-containing protein [Actinotignum sanguinis]